MKAVISEYNTSYDDNVKGPEEIIVNHPSYFICYYETRFQISHKGTKTNTNIEYTLRASEIDTDEVSLSWYE